MAATANRQGGRLLNSEKDDTVARLPSAGHATPPARLNGCRRSGSDYNPANLSVTKPDGCFRISANGVNYLADYSIELAAAGSAVSWGTVDWTKVYEEGANPFMELTCDTVMVAAADEVDVCALFEDEVDRALEAGWGGAEANTDVDLPYYDDGRRDADSNVPGAGNTHLGRPSPRAPAKDRQFGTMIWYDIDGDGKPGDDLYNDTERR